MSELANIRHNLKCDVCGTVTLVRTQLGWLDQHPLRVQCGNCNILISGTAFLNQSEGTCHFEFNNAEIVEETRPSYFIEASGELLTEKLQEYKDTPDIPFYPTPFIESINSMGPDKMGEFKGRTLQFLYLSKNDWPKIRRINELWFNQNYKYLVEQVAELLPQKQFPMYNELEYLRGVHQLNLMFLKSIIDVDIFKSITNFIWKEIKLLIRNDVKGLSKLAKQFEEQKLLHRLDEKIFKLIEQMANKFQFLIPVFALKFYNNKDDRLMEKKGITTASFEDLKQFYLDCYEVAGEGLTLLVAYNNLKYRQNFETMMPKRRDINTIYDFEAKSKGIRVGFVDGTEDFDTIVYPNLDNKLRNAIGHNTIKYDGATQIIIYYPSGHEDEADENKIYLVQFAAKCWDIFQSINSLAELIYQTRKIYYVTEKGCTSVNPEVFGKDKKVGRNDPCPCGSGKKYKKCCGTK